MLFKGSTQDCPYFHENKKQVDTVLHQANELYYLAASICWDMWLSASTISSVTSQARQLTSSMFHAKISYLPYLYNHIYSSDAWIIWF